MCVCLLKYKAKLKTSTSIANGKDDYYKQQQKLVYKQIQQLDN